MKKFQNKYRIESARLRHWDYGWNSAYFVTICTKGRKCFFGNIDSGKMSVSEIGEIVCECWDRITERFAWAKLDEFVLMPNHIHGVVIIDKPYENHNNNSIDQMV